MRSVLLAALLMVPVAAQAQQAGEPQPRTLSVNATGMVEREPDQGLVLLAVESEAQTAKAAADANAAKMSQLVASLRSVGVPDRNIRTVSYELRPEYQNRENQPARIAAYRAINMVQVTVDTVARMGGIIDASINSGANRVANIQFQLKDARGAYAEALAIAMRNARREAEIVAEAAGETLGPAQSIHTGGFAPPPSPMPMYRRAEMLDMAASAPTPIEGGTLTTTASVQVVFRLVDR